MSSCTLQRCLATASTSRVVPFSAARTRCRPHRIGRPFRQPIRPRASSDRDNNSRTASSSDASTNKPAIPDASTSKPLEAEVVNDNIDDMLRPAFEKSKEEVIGALGLGRTEADMIRKMQYEDLDNVDAFLGKVAQETIGPILDVLGLDEDPLQFIKDLLVTSTMLQIGTCLVTYYGVELGLHWEASEAARVTSGLFLGYLTRPFLQVEQFLQPMYEAVMRLLSENATYEVPSAPASQIQKALNVIAFVVATVFLVPQALLLWTPAESVQLVVPMAVGWVLFDVCYAIALLVKCRML